MPPTFTFSPYEPDSPEAVVTLREYPSGTVFPRHTHRRGPVLIVTAVTSVGVAREVFAPGRR